MPRTIFTWERVAMVAMLAILITSTFAFAPAATANLGAPANKVSASGSTIEVAEQNETVELLRATVKLSNPYDLIMSVSLECSISTEIITVGNDSANAAGTLDIWIEVDGVVVPVSIDDINSEDPGEVTFCSRAYGRETSLFDDEDASIRSFIDTKQAHAFNWLGLNDLWSGAPDLGGDGDQTHEIVLYGRLTADVSDQDQSARVAIGKRTLLLEPTKVANGETVTID